jgi:hypothetical protein
MHAPRCATCDSSFLRIVSQPVPILDLRCESLDVVTPCRSADFPILQLALQGLRRFVPFSKLYVITARENILRFRRRFSEEVDFLDQDSVIPGMTLAGLRRLSLPGFPQGAGWYFQQLLKFAFDGSA